jgi:hypothetical protein
VNRIQVAQAALDTFENPNYLEIGVCTGESFIPMRAKRKWGVDPGYIISWKRRLKYAVFSFLGIKTENLYRMTSDDFFEKKKDMLKSLGVHVCFVDGLHTYEQALRDVLNALEDLKPGGIILMHDCNPITEAMALPAASIEAVSKADIPGWNGAWSGDVWKAVVHLRSLYNDLNVFTLDCDTGIGVVSRGKPQTCLTYSQSDIDLMDYSFFAPRRKELLDLRSPEEFSGFLRAK